MNSHTKWLIETKRLLIRRSLAIPQDINFLHSLWNNPEVMKFVGFPYGLRMQKDAIEKQLATQTLGEYDVVLIIILKETEEYIGNCKLGAPNKEKKANTDVKIDPKFWGNKYGIEIKQALLDYLFINTDCIEVTADPNWENIASIKMQEAVGGVRVGEETYSFPKSMKEFTCDIPLYIYTVTREIWQNRNGENYKGKGN